MSTMILISIVAVAVGVIGCAVIWGLDRRRAEEIDHEPPPPSAARPAAVPVTGRARRRQEVRPRRTDQ